MANTTSVLLRNGRHASATTRYMLLCDNFSISIAKTPIQVPLPQQSPVLIDLGMYRPTISISGLVDNIGGASGVGSTAITRSMSSVSLTLKNSLTPFGSTAQTYYHPYKNALETAAYLWLTDTDTPLEIEVLDASIPLSTASVDSTGGGIYPVTFQQARFQVDAAKEDRWSFQMQFAAGSRVI